MQVCIRVDDIGWSAEACEPWPQKKPDAGLSLAQQFHQAMGGLPYLGAIIPKMIDPEGLAWLQSNPQGLTIAQHGFSHSAVDGRVPDEFWAMPTLEVRDWIAKGRDLLGVAPAHYVPPFNSLTGGHPEALAQLGFRYLWVMPSSQLIAPYKSPQGLLEIPAYLPLYGCSIARMDSTSHPLLETAAELIPAAGRAVMTLHLPWEFAKSPDLSGLKQLVALIRDHVISPEEYLRAV